MQHDLPENQPQHEGSPIWLTLREAALRVPGSPHESTVSRWTRFGVRGRLLPSTIVGGRRLIKLNDLTDFLALEGGEVR